MWSGKIFGIGLSRTGTKSLVAALKILGFDLLHRGGDLTLSEIDEHDGGADIAFTSIYKELDKMYPKSKFIMTCRSLDNWLVSCKNKLPNKEPAPSGSSYAVTRLKVYGYDIGTGYDEKKLTKAYHKHNHDVEKYFRKRKEDLLILDICGGEGWDELCKFLEAKKPTQPFPNIK